MLKRVFVLAACLLLAGAATMWFRYWMNPHVHDHAHAEAIKPAVQTVTLLQSPNINERGVAGEGASTTASTPGFDWQIPDWLPPPPVPPLNPMSDSKVSLGRYLFYDHRLSADGTIACSSCHQQELGFSDGLAKGVGVRGITSERNSMTLANVGYSSVLTWANPHLRTLERQALIPLFGEEPVEMGLAGQESQLLARLRQEPVYQKLAAQAFPDSDTPLDLAGITRALAAFQRTMISVGSAYDRYKYGGEPDAMSAAALRGEAVFFSEEAECYHCHQGFNFTDTLQTSRSGFAEVAFYNTGLYDVDGKGAYPFGGHGLKTFSSKDSDMGKFRTQSLRNVAVSAPYFHDGSAATLDDVITHYASGGSSNPYKDPLVGGFSLDGTVREDLKAFLHSLTDHDFLNNPRFSDPWPDKHPARVQTSATPLSE